MADLQKGCLGVVPLPFPLGLVLGAVFAGRTSAVPALPALRALVQARSCHIC